MSFLPKSDQVKKYFLGFQTIFADYLWIKTTLYFGSHTLSDKQYPYLASLVDITSRLNPRLFPAYEFAGVILPAVGSSRDIARIILMRGMSVYGTTQWRIPFYLGWMYYQYYNDPLNAARYLAAAGECPDAPDYIRGLAATMYVRSDNVELGKVFLYDLYKSSSNPQTRKFLMEKLDVLSKENGDK